MQANTMRGTDPDAYRARAIANLRSLQWLALDCEFDGLAMTRSYVDLGFTVTTELTKVSCCIRKVV